MSVSRFVAHSPVDRRNGTYLYLPTPRQILCDGMADRCSRPRVRVLEGRQQHGCGRVAFLGAPGVFTLDFADKLSGAEELELTRSMKVSEVTQSTERRISCLPTETILIHTYTGTAMS